MLKNKSWTTDNKGSQFVCNLTADVLTSSLIRHVLRFHDAKASINIDESGFSPRFYFEDNLDFKMIGHN